MKIKSLHFNGDWNTISTSDDFNNKSCQLVLAFGDNSLVKNCSVMQFLKSSFPEANIAFASTSGEISGENVYDNSLTAVAIQFEKSSVKCITANIKDHKGSYEAGEFLRASFPDRDLNFIFVLSDGTKVNGSELVKGLNSKGSKQVLITGGLAGDSARFQKTYTGLNNEPTEGNLVAIGFYGKDLKIGHGSLGGWDEFGPTRSITRADKNVLYEIDNKSALDMYKEYLGPFKDELPGSALLFPLSISGQNADQKIVRTILSIDEENKSMTFAGDMPEGSKVRLMKANFDRIIKASESAAEFAKNDSMKGPDLAILISCVGRKLILQERTYEEVMAAKAVLGADTVVTGFYSYGEISPYNNISSTCELHNQTMTITTISEL